MNARHTKPLLGFSAKALRTDARIEALEIVLRLLAQHCGVDGTHIEEMLREASAESLQKRLESVEDVDPATAALVDHRPLTRRDNAPGS